MTETRDAAHGPRAETAAEGLDAHLVVDRGTFRLDVALTVAPGDVVALLGPNGAGKTTALRALAGLSRSPAAICGWTAPSWTVRPRSPARSASSSRTTCSSPT